MRGSRILPAVLAVALLGAGCEERVAPSPPRRPDARAPRLPPRPPSLAPRFAPPTPAERAYDTQHREPLGGVVTALQATFRTLNQLVKKGAGSPAWRRRWPTQRQRYLGTVGKLRAQVLAVDPLGTRSWAARVASRLVADLEVRLPAAVPDSWGARPSGALSTARADFTLIWQQLRRYVSTLNNARSKGSPP